MGVKYSDLPRTNTVHMDDRVAVLSSTDDILKTVPAGSLGGVFVGTSAQWAALTAEQKAQYDQKQVILTDGEGGGFNPVEITYADWIALPPAQRNSGTWLVTGFPVATNADLIPYTGDVQAANVGAAINALNQNLTDKSGFLRSNMRTTVIVAYSEPAGAFTSNYTIPRDGFVALTGKTLGVGHVIFKIGNMIIFQAISDDNVRVAEETIIPIKGGTILTVSLDNGGFSINLFE